MQKGSQEESLPAGLHRVRMFREYDLRESSLDRPRVKSNCRFDVLLKDLLHLVLQGQFSLFQSYFFEPLGF